MKINTNSNVYTICYAAVMVVLVAFLLAFVSSALKPAQDANVAIDKRTQILASLNVRGIAKSDVEAKYNELIQETFVLTPDGQQIEGADAFDVDTKEIGEKFPVYVAKTAEGEDAYVLPLKGRGLWGGIWGYVAVTLDGEKVLGAFFNHESETAGLGALIKDEPFQSQFIGRPVFGADGKVALTVVKKGESKAEAEVDGVTGATLTSKGVGEMVQTGIQQYVDVIGKGIVAAFTGNAGGCGKHEGCKKAEKCCDKPDCKCAEKKLCACKDGSCGDAACNCASDAKCCAREECPCASCEKVAPCVEAEGCSKAEGCGKAKLDCCNPCKCENCCCPMGADGKCCNPCECADCCKSGADCCKSGADCCKSGADCCKSGKDCCKSGADCCKSGKDCCKSGEDCCKSGADCCKSGADCCKSGADCCKSGADCCKSGNNLCKSNDCCKSVVCDKSGSCGKPGCDGDKACCGKAAM